jgi:DNA-binding NtrC family response regulator
MEPNNNLNILVADDEDGLRISLASILELEGYNVRTAENGEEAINIIQDPSFDLDIAFLDIRMPNFTGVDALKQINIHKPSTTAVMMTAYAMNDLIREAIAEGVFACVSKPFEIDTMLNTILEIRSKTLVMVLNKDLDAAKPVIKTIKAKGAIATLQLSKESALELIKRRKPNIILIDKSFEADAPDFQTALADAQIIITAPDTINAAVNSLFADVKQDKPALAIVSDDIIESNNLKLELVSKNYDVDYFQTPEAMLQALEHKKTSVIFVDSKLIKEDLINFHDSVKQKYPSSEVVYIFDYDTTIGANLGEKGIRHIQRPFDPEDVIKVISENSQKCSCQ